jgi:hypothetical protein
VSTKSDKRLDFNSVDAGCCFAVLSTQTVGGACLRYRSERDVDAQTPRQFERLKESEEMSKEARLQGCPLVGKIKVLDGEVAIRNAKSPHAATL